MKGGTRVDVAPTIEVRTLLVNLCRKPRPIIDRNLPLSLQQLTSSVFMCEVKKRSITINFKPLKFISKTSRYGVVLPNR